MVATRRSPPIAAHSQSVATILHFCQTGNDTPTQVRSAILFQVFFGPVLTFGLDYSRLKGREEIHEVYMHTRSRIQIQRRNY